MMKEGVKLYKNNITGDFGMKYLPDGLRREYDFLIRNNPDIEELKHPLINFSDVLRAYFILIHYFTDTTSDDEAENMLVGIRSTDLLYSALTRQIVSICRIPKYTNPLDICATLFFGLVKNHSLNDGNKRTALLILLYQLYLYGYNPIAPKKEFEKLVLSVAEDSLNTVYQSYYRKFKKDNDWKIRVISFALKKKMVSKKDNSYHMAPTMKEFCAALDHYGITYTVENSKVRFSYISSGKWFVFKDNERNYSIPFNGWTRTVGAKTARDVLDNLGLYEQFPTYQDLMNGVEPLYTLVDDFKEPLRRLKDK